MLNALESAQDPVKKADSDSVGLSRSLDLAF